MSSNEEDADFASDNGVGSKNISVSSGADNSPLKASNSSKTKKMANSSDDECLALKKQQKRKKSPQSSTSSSEGEPLVSVVNRKNQAKKKKIDANGCSSKNDKKPSKSVDKKTSKSADKKASKSADKKPSKKSITTDDDDDDNEPLISAAKAKFGGKPKPDSDSDLGKPKSDSSKETLRESVKNRKSKKEAPTKSRSTSIGKKSGSKQNVKNSDNDDNDSTNNDDDVSTKKLSSIATGAQKSSEDSDSDSREKATPKNRRSQKSVTKIKEQKSVTKKSTPVVAKPDISTNKKSFSSSSSSLSDSDSNDDDDEKIGRKIVEPAVTEKLKDFSYESESCLKNDNVSPSDKPPVAESSSDTSVHDSDAEGTKRKSPVKKRKKSKKISADENGGATKDVSPEEKSEERKAKVAPKVDEEHPRITKLKKFIRLAGLRCVYKQLFADCADNDKVKIKKLEEFCESKGLSGPITIESCKQFKLKNEEKKELAALDVRNIISNEQMSRRSNTKKVPRKKYEDSESDSSSDHETKEKECKSMFARLRDIVDDGESD